LIELRPEGGAICVFILHVEEVGDGLVEALGRDDNIG
jgi:hypothetical protein